MGDIDLDGDIDALGRGTNADDQIPYLYYYENMPGLNGKPSYLFPWIGPFGLPASGEEDNLLFPSLVDIDGDTDLDLFIVRLNSDDQYDLEYYENDLANALEIPTDQQRFYIEPQPASAGVSLYYPQTRILEMVIVYDMTGSELMSKPFPGSWLDLSALPTGMYLLSAIFKEETHNLMINIIQP